MGVCGRVREWEKGGRIGGRVGSIGRRVGSGGSVGSGSWFVALTMKMAWGMLRVFDNSCTCAMMFIRVKFAMTL